MLANKGLENFRNMLEIEIIENEATTKRIKTN